MQTFKQLKRLLPIAIIVGAASLTGCANTSTPRDYSAFKLSNPKSILVLPPVNNSPDVKATYSLYSQVSFPLAEAGYYVVPVTLVDETFKQNGVTNPNDMHATPIDKLREIFGADAVMYVKITKYGATYTVFNSVAVVAAEAQLVDLKTGTVLWTGSASASNDEGNNNNGANPLALLVTAVVKQVMNSVTDAAYPVAGVAANRLLSARQEGVSLQATSIEALVRDSSKQNGVLPGPRLILTKKD
jgi:hypothetical protein